MKQLQFGLDTFGDITHDKNDQPLHAAQVIRNVIAEAQLADELGIDTFALGEHHRDDFAVSSPEIVLAAIAATTKNITVGTGVTVLSSDDAVRVYERFATLDAVASGRSEIILGRGSFTESFPLFGYSLNDYEMLFNEKLALFKKLQTEGPVTWSGSHRPLLSEQEVYPKTERGHVNAWIGVGGNPESVLRAVSTQTPMMLAIIGGEASRFKPFVQLYQNAQEELGFDTFMPLGAHSPGHIAATDELAMEEFFEHFKRSKDRIGRERGWPPVTEASYRAEIKRGALYVGSPETVARKIAETVKLLDLDRFDFKYATGTMPHEMLMRSIELYGTQVKPLVLDMLNS